MHENSRNLPATEHGAGYLIRCIALILAILPTLAGIVVAESVVMITASGINGGSGGNITVKQCPNWAPNPDQFSTATRLEADAVLRGSQDADRPEKFYFSQVGPPQEVTENPISITVSGHLEIHCRYAFKARVTGDFSAGPVGLVIFAGAPYLLPTGQMFPDSIVRRRIDRHWVEVTLIPGATSGQADGGSLTFVTNDCGWMPSCMLEANGGDAVTGPGGRGGAILFQTPGGTQAWIEARGGSGGNGTESLPAGGGGGDGGRIAVSSRGGDLSFLFADCRGGRGGSTASRNLKPGEGGQGGEITATDLRFGTSGQLVARGGAGGEPMATRNPQDDPGAIGAGGDGGRGGVIHLALKPEEEAAFVFYGDPGTQGTAYPETLRVGGLDVCGGEATSGYSVGGRGGNAGHVTIESPWATQFKDTTVLAYGGHGGFGRYGYDSSRPDNGLPGADGGPGGNAGILSISGGISFSGTVANMNGGIGGTGGKGGYGEEVGGKGGEGGDGGRNGLLKLVLSDNTIEFGLAGPPGNGGEGGDGSNTAGNGGKGGDSASPDRTPGKGGAPGLSYDYPGQFGANGGFITIAPPEDLPLPAPDLSDHRCQTPPIIFVPGIAASVLRDRGDGMNQLWPSLFPSVFDNDAVRRLSTIPGDGADDVIATDILRSAVNSDWMPLGAKPIYQPLIDYFNGLGYDEFKLENDPSRITNSYMLEPERFRNKPTLFVFPYDWRKSNKVSAGEIAHYIENISELHGNSKVRIVAHSMGGLVLRQLMVTEPSLVSNCVEGAVTIGTPFLGAPKSIYSMLHGDFYEVSVIDWIKNDAIKYVLPTFDGACELLPSQAFFDLNRNGVPVFAESGWNIDNKLGVGTVMEIPEISAHFRRTISANYPVAIRPYDVNSRLHTPGFDNWSADATGLPILHLAGMRNKADTIVGVRAKGRHDPEFAHAETTGFYYYGTIKGCGDKTVPLLSAARNSGYLAPKAVMRVLTGVKDPDTRIVHGGEADLEHSQMVGNPRILEWTSHFLGNVAQVDSYERFPDLPPEPQGDRMVVTVIGRTHVNMATAAGTNGISTSPPNSVAASSIPGVEITYHEPVTPGIALGQGGSLPGMVATCNSGETVFLSGEIQVPALVSILRSVSRFTPPLAVEPPDGFPESVGVQEAISFWPGLGSYQRDSLERDYQNTKWNARVAVFVERFGDTGNLVEIYKCSFAIPRTGSRAHDSGTFRWEMIVNPGQPPLGWIDWDRDRVVEVEELVFPEIAKQFAGGLPMSRPELVLQLAPSANGTKVQLSSGGALGNGKRLFISFDGGKFVEYSSGSHPDLLVGSHRLVRAYVVDEVGNSSETLEFTLDPIPTLEIGPGGAGEVRLTWAASGLPVVLEAATNLGGPWTPFGGTVDINSSSEREATISTVGEKAQFFRLRLVQ